MHAVCPMNKFAFSLLIAGMGSIPAHRIIVVTLLLHADAVAGISCAVLLALFAVQRFGTARLGTAFSPVLIVWFLFNGGVGIYDIAACVANPLSLQDSQFCCEGHPRLVFIYGCIYDLRCSGLIHISAPTTSWEFHTHLSQSWACWITCRTPVLNSI